MKHSRSFFARFSTGLALFGLLFVETGCSTVEKYSLTHRLWDTDEFRKFSEPALDPNLALFKARQDHEVLVQYDARSVMNDVVKRRAYYRRLNQAHISSGKKPRFVNLLQAAGLTPIPVLKLDSANTNAPPDFAEYAVTTNEERRFALYLPTGRRETHSLPVYPETSGMAARIALTPFAVAGDTIRVAGVVAFIGLIALAESHTSLTIH